LAKTFHYPHSSLDFNQVREGISFWNAVERVAQRSIDPKSTEDERLRTALGFLGKGDRSEPEEAVLYYWIGIDALLTIRSTAPVVKPEVIDSTEDLALRFFAAAAALEERHRRMEDLYHRISNAWRLRDEPRFSPTMSAIKEDLAIRSQLVLAPFEILDLSRLLKALPEWSNALPTGSLKDHVTATRAFFEDRRVMKNLLTDSHRHAALETAIIYQIRNRLVHHAHSASNSLRFLRERAGNMLRTIINYAADERFDLPETVALTINAWDRLNVRLRSPHAIDLWSFKGIIREDITSTEGGSR
jgi:hypothetical protein